MKTITMTLDEYNADIKKAREEAEVEKYKPLVDLVWEITAIVRNTMTYGTDYSSLPGESVVRPYHNWTKEELIERLRRSMVQIGEFDGILDRKEQRGQK
jgi:hypothetical protein